VNRAGPRPLWSFALTAAPRGLFLAREVGRLLAWTDNGRLTLLDLAGRVQARSMNPEPLAAAAVSDDGSAIARASDDRVEWLAPDLSVRWGQALPDRATALALDSLGQYVAAGDGRGGIRLIDRFGRAAGTFTAPRPAYHLLLTPAAPRLFAAADYGWVGCLAPPRERWQWQDRPVAHVAGMAAGPVGDPLVLGCFTQGLRRYRGDGYPEAGAPGPVFACHALALTFDGRLGVAVDRDGLARGFDSAGAVRWQYPLGQPAAAVALTGSGDRLFAALADGTLTAVELRPTG
jgi:hypothetical protein